MAYNSQPQYLLTGARNLTIGFPSHSYYFSVHNSIPITKKSLLPNIAQSTAKRISIPSRIKTRKCSMLTSQPKQSNIPSSLEYVEHQIRHHSIPVERVGVLSYRIEPNLAYACDYCSLLLVPACVTRNEIRTPSLLSACMHAWTDGIWIRCWNWTGWTGLDWMNMAGERRRG